VSALARSVRDLLERQLPLSWITGEISNFTAARSGHWYFVLKDATAQVRCVMFRGRNQYLDWQPRDGVQVDLRALPGFYEARGEFQLTVETMRRGGLGALFERFLQLRDRLAGEGLFDAAAKRALPPMPRRIGVISSTAGAALHDVITTLRRRNAMIEVIIYPSAVQGERSAEELVAALGRASARDEVDVLLLVRGGGSIEDLWSFNDEQLARAIRASQIPVISGVGHETDFTIADFAADVRAPTPTAAAEMASPPLAALATGIDQAFAALGRALNHQLQTRMQRVDGLARRLQHPAERLARQRLRLTTASQALERAMRRHIGLNRMGVQQLVHRLSRSRPATTALLQHTRSLADRASRAAHESVGRRTLRVAALVRALEHLDPERVLQRGFGIVEDAEGRVLTHAAAVQPGDRVRVRLAHGSIGTEVREIEPG
jgi:exodeoxyribonuclease VII large subunit